MWEPALRAIANVGARLAGDGDLRSPRCFARKARSYTCLLATEGR